LKEKRLKEKKNIDKLCVSAALLHFGGGKSSPPDAERKHRIACEGIALRAGRDETRLKRAISSQRSLRGGFVRKFPKNGKGRNREYRGPVQGAGKPRRLGGEAPCPTYPGGRRKENVREE